MIEKIRMAFQGMEVEELKKGWSTDRKFILTDGTERYTLRCSKERTLEDQKKEYEEIRKINHPEVIIRPLQFGTLDEEMTYILYTYAEGEDLRETLEVLSDTGLHELGLTAGNLLKEIHGTKAESERDFESHYNLKIDTKIRAYRDSGLDFPEVEEHIRYIETHRYLLEGRPVVLQHGDYHIGNMVVSEGRLKIIDFSRYDYGDPYDEFNRMPMNSIYSKSFSKGMVEGYFGGEPPLGFWKLLKLFVLVNAIASPRWAQKNSPDSMDFIMGIFRETLKDYEDKTQDIPRWYSDVTKQG